MSAHRYCSVEVRVKLGASNNVARAGNGKAATIASSTNSGHCAAIKAVGKYFGRLGRGKVLRLELTQRGDVCARTPEIYTAVVEGSSP